MHSASPAHRPAAGANPRHQDNAARQELRRLVSNRRPPGDVGASAFGPWAGAVTALRVRTLEQGPDACRALFLEKVRENPRLGVLLASDPEPEGYKKFWGWVELQETDFPDPVWVVPGIIPCGLVSIGGRPKVGKSWLALQIACAVGTGGQVFGRPVRKGKVLYLALEDSPRRLKNRALKQLWPDEVDVTFDIEWPYLGQGGTAELRKWIEKDGYTLVVVDTLTRALEGPQQRGPGRGRAGAQGADPGRGEAGQHRALVPGRAGGGRGAGGAARSARP